jgi:DNA-binding IclR family transcriptional regulator
MEKQLSTVPNIERAITIIELLSSREEGFSLQELIDQTSLAKTTVFRILNTLLKHGYVYKESNNSFVLTKKFLMLGLSSMGDDSLIEKSLGVMRQLKDEINETVLIGTMVDSKIVMLDQVIGNHPFTFFIKPGKKIDMHVSAPGKAYLAFCDQSEREIIIGEMEMTKYNENTITNKAKFKTHIDAIQKTGYAIDCAEELEGVHCIGAPIFSANGQPVALLWATGPSARLPQKDFVKNGELIKEYALKISERLGYIRK